VNDSTCRTPSGCRVSCDARVLSSGSTTRRCASAVCRAHDAHRTRSKAASRCARDRDTHAAVVTACRAAARASQLRARVRRTSSLSARPARGCSTTCRSRSRVRGSCFFALGALHIVTASIISVSVSAAARIRTGARCCGRVVLHIAHSVTLALATSAGSPSSRLVESSIAARSCGSRSQLRCPDAQRERLATTFAFGLITDSASHPRCAS